MARRDTGGSITLSVLDRLIDQDPKHTAEVPLSRSQALRELKASVRRDLEWLLNSRRTIDPASDSAPETARSVYHYGLSDLSCKSALSSKDQSDLAREIELAITFFEPRLKRVKVRMEAPAPLSQTVHFVIEGLLTLDPAPEPIRFDSALDVGRANHKVTGDDVAR